jgi:hypothetical protein
VIIKLLADLYFTTIDEEAGITDEKVPIIDGDGK